MTWRRASRNNPRGWFAGLVVLNMALASGCADRLILYPTQGRVDSHGASRRALRRPGGKTLEVWVARSPAAEGGRRPAVYVLEFTGNATRAEHVAAYSADLWGDRSAEVWAVNYPGYGGSTGPATLKDIPAAALEAYDALAREAAGRPIVLSGVSLGTAAALHVAAERPTGVSGVVLKNPPPLRQLILGRFGWWNLWLGAGFVAAGVPGALDSIVNARRCRMRGVFVLGDRDELVTPKYQRMVVEAYAGEKRVIGVKDGTHNSPLTDEAEVELRAALRWVATTRQND